MKSLVAAVSFLTRLPVGRLVRIDSEDVARSAGWFPLIGVLLAAITGGAAVLLRGHLPDAMAAVVLVLIDVLVTGALHYDGLADTADGFGGGQDRDNVLRIMRDHSIGSYGGVALILLIAFKVIAYSVLLQRVYWLSALIVTPVLGRWSMLLLTATLPYARPASSVAQGMGKLALLWGTLTTAAVLFAFWFPRAWQPAAAVLIVTILFGLYCRRRIRGVTGDTLGANLQLCESAALLAFLWQ